MWDIKTFFDEDAIYFANCKRSITSQNNRMLTDGCALYALVLAFYTVLSVATGQSTLLRTMYYVYDALHLLLCVAVFTRSDKRKAHFAETQTLCAVLELLILSFFALEGSITSQTQHSLYVPIAILLLQLLFIHRAGYAFLIIFLYTGSFAVLSRLYKTPEAYTNDFYIAVATFISANIGYALIAGLRINEQKAMDKFESLSRTDILTGLCNKAAFVQLCENRLQQSEQPCTLLIFDIDDFKKVNDVYGHDIGDEVLKGVGDALKRVFRTNDIMGRFGGDEFVVFMDSCADADVVQSRMDTFRQRMETLSTSIPGLAARCSAGAAFRREGDDFRAMFARADSALYDAKRDGKDRLKMEDGPSAAE